MLLLNINEKSRANKFFVQIANEKGLSISAEYFSENDETAREEALAAYKEQYKEEATGRIIKFIRYRWAWEVHEFCKEKYGSSTPDKFECGNLIWLNVPNMGMPGSPMKMKCIPYLVIEEMKQVRDELQKKLNKHEKKYPKLPNGIRVYNIDNHPDLKEYAEPVKEWYRVHFELIKELNSIIDKKRLSSEQLELLGINFNVYKRK